MAKRVIYFLLILSVAVFSIGCNKTNTESNNSSSEKLYSDELLKYFPSVEGTVLNYCGVLEYEQTLTLNNVIDNDKEIKLNFKGEILDQSEGEGLPKKDRILETEYIIGKNSVKEVQKNLNRRYSQSVIREQVVLKLPIEKGNTWNQKVVVDGKEYTAQTKITDVFKDDKNKSIVKTETVIKGIENYPENTYREIKIFKEGKGLVEFKNTILLGEDKNPFEFGYMLFELNK
ncbi:hypothetical protein [Tepidibacter thalassicus]|uniref:Lipoprotein n=1 Tax=Tepidibacter thalassicus DSM 15285 TaxID=1123350 RepID=A0A1M5QTU3_9FIRM|nr:hypothetical protein [Tepidibacter thalassicus]SHH17502.1 hypothetical protein SAMN02744040_01101 [Tepidibacter thalassicus DSM 15285]